VRVCLTAANRPNKRVKGLGMSCLTLRGGTDAAFAPPIGYLQHVFLPTFKRLTSPQCSGLSLELVKRGFYPQGGGVAQLSVPALPSNTPLPCWELTERGHLVSITGYAVTAGKLRPDIAQRMATAAKHGLQPALKDPAVLFGPQLQASSSSKADTSSSTAAASSDTAAEQAGSSRSPSSIPSVVVDIQAVQEPLDRAVGNGGSILLVAETSTGCLFGASAIAERGVTAEAVGALAARDLLEDLRSGAAVDQW
jgi:RNA 3'-terminal phosphate cyclase (ATP)